MKVDKRFAVLIPVLLALAACSYEKAFVNREAIHSKPRMAAVLPLVNHTSYPNAGRIVGDLLITELYTGTNFRIMEHTQMLDALRGEENDLEEVLETSVAQQVGRDLGVDTVIYGSVTEYRYKRGLDEDPVVGINLWMLDVASREILWAGSKSATGGCFWFCEDSLNRLAQKVCHDLVKNMASVK